MKKLKLLLILLFCPLLFLINQKSLADDLPLKARVFENESKYEPAKMGETLKTIYLTGEKDLLILKEHKPFVFKFDTSGEFSSNAYRSGRIRKSDFYYTHTISGQFNTIINEKYNVYLESGVNQVRYNKLRELDYDTPFVRAGVYRYFGKLIVGGNVSGDFVQSAGANDRLVHMLNLNTYASYVIPIGKRAYIQPRLMFSGTPASSPTDYINASLIGGVDVMQMITDKITILYGVDGYGRLYNNFYGNILDKKRRDAGLVCNAMIKWNILNDWKFLNDLTIAGGFRFGLMNSSIDAFDYTEFSGSPYINISFKF